MFTSPKPVVFMQCGHSIHGRCYEEHMRRSYKCPICNKSLLNMETQFRQLELEILAQPMPQEFRDTKAVVLCNDCSGKSTVPYHWLGLKCAICSSYNTVELRMSAPRQWSTNPDAPPPLSPPAGPVVPAEMQGGGAGTAAVPIARHRRFSSLAVPQAAGGGGAHRGPLDDRMARSSSPMRHRPPPGVVSGVIPDGIGHQHEEAEDSDEDILSFWNSRTDESEEESASDEGDAMTESDEEDDDDDNDIMLIGHR
jgi:zinc ribbon protein/RING finger family protein